MFGTTVEVDDAFIEQASGNQINNVETNNKTHITRATHDPLFETKIKVVGCNSRCGVIGTKEC